MKESAIIHERGDYFVVTEPGAYTVCESKATHAITRQSFARTADGRANAIAYANYLAGARGKATLEGVTPNAKQ